MKKTDFIRKAVVKGKEYRFVDIQLLEKKGIAKIGRLPFSIRILVENLLRKMDGRVVKESDVLHIAKWKRSYDAPRSSKPRKWRGSPRRARSSLLRRS